MSLHSSDGDIAIWLTSDLTGSLFEGAEPRPDFITDVRNGIIFTFTSGDDSGSDNRYIGFYRAL